MSGDASRRCLRMSPAGGEKTAWSAHHEAAERRRALPNLERVASPRASLIRGNSQRRFVPETFHLPVPQTRCYRFGVSITERCTKLATLFRRWITSGKASKSMRTNRGRRGRSARRFHQAFRTASISGGDRSTRLSRLVHRVRPVQGGDLRMRGASRADATTFGWFGTADRRQAIRASEPGAALELPKPDGRDRHNG